MFDLFAQSAVEMQVVQTTNYLNPAMIHFYVHECLTWIGFGVVSGLLAKAILPGKDPGGVVVTAVLGLFGALIGGAVYAWAGGDKVRDLISPIGFAVSVGGAMVLLLSHRLFSGRIIDGEGDRHHAREPNYRRRGKRVRLIEDA